MTVKLAGKASLATFRTVSLVCCLACCMLVAACGGAHTQPVSEPEAGPAHGAGPARVAGHDLPATGEAATGRSGGGEFSPVRPGLQAQPELPGSQNTPQAGIPAMAPVWQPLATRLAADGLSAPRVDALLATLASTPSQSPMGRKMLELYKSRFMPRPPSAKPTPTTYYKGVVTEQNARLCRAFIAEHKQAFSQAQARYGVPSSVAVALLFVETRLGKVLADVPENALYTLASMAVSRDPSQIDQWLPRMPGYEAHMDWLQETMPKRADWAYKEVRALVRHILQDDLDPQYLPSSIYGAVGLCQFMPSNIAAYGADGDDDGKIDLFHVPDAVASLSNYLARHGWKPGISRAQQHKVLMTYNRSTVYANTILALADLVQKPEAATGKTSARGQKEKNAGSGKSGKARPGVPAGQGS